MPASHRFLAFLLSCTALAAQAPRSSLEGSWLGSFVFGDGKIKRILYVSAAQPGILTGALIDPETGAAVSLDAVTLTDHKVAFESKARSIHFDGSLSAANNEINGQMKQADISMEVTLRRQSQPESDIAATYNKSEYMIPMRDGTRLHTIVFAPKKANGPLPFLIERSPYGFEGVERVINLSLKDLALDGYLFVFQDIRGRYQSEGKFIMQRPVRDAADPKSIDEGTDTYDSIDWLLKQIPDNNGRAGIFGISYGGWLTEMALIQPHPALKAASEQASPADMFLGDDFHHNGAFRLSYGFEYASMMETGNTNKTFQFKQYDTYDFYLQLGPLREANSRYLDGQRPTWNNFVAHPNYDAFWKKLAVQRYVGSGRVPNLNVGGWFDQEDFAGPWRIFGASETPESKKYNYLVVGPWNHGGWAAGPGRSLKSVDFGSNTGEYFRQKVQAKWFGYWLKDQGTLNLSRIHLFETGLNEWKSYNEWPPQSSVERRLYLLPSGEASFEKPTAGADSFVSYVSDPHKPVPYRERPIPETYGGSPGWSTWHVDDQRFAESRPDVAVWQTKPLEEDVTIAGKVIADLFASTSGTDSDWVVKLIDVYPPGVPADPPMGGYELMVAADVLRGRFRNSFETPEPVTANVPAEYKVDLLSHDHMFRKGHRIMVQVQNTWFPVIDRNPQTFVPNIFQAKESDFQPATQHVFGSAAHPSAIVLPILTAPR